MIGVMAAFLYLGFIPIRGSRLAKARGQGDEENNRCNEERTGAGLQSGKNVGSEPLLPYRYQRMYTSLLMYTSEPSRLMLKMR